MVPRNAMARSKISTTIYITEEQDRQLKELSRRTNVPVAVYVREGIDIVIRQHGDVLPGQLPLLKPRGD
jgi:predicted DNA-binding protein